MRSSVRGILGRPEAVVAAAIVGFFAISAWWVSQEHRVPSWDPAGHMFIALWFKDRIGSGDVLFPFTYYNSFGYPPLTQLVGAAGTVVAGTSVASLVLTQNVVFMPLLAIGSYGAGALAYGSRWAGALAAVFALGSPMIASLFHIFMLDTPETAMVAVTVWLLLASDRFARPRWSLAAGVVFGLGMLTKLTFAVFPAGMIAVMLLRGGWRNARGAALFAGGVAVLGVPYYLRHAEEIVRYSAGSNVTGTSLGDFGADPGRLSIGNLTWYAWNALNVEPLAPFALLAAIGIVVGAVRFVRRRAPDDQYPELLAGAGLAYLVITALAHNDNRYMLPATVYLALFGTGWIATARRPAARVAGSVGVLAVAVVNVVMPSFGVGGVARADLPGNPRPDRVHTGQVTFFSDEGYLYSGPESGGNVGAILDAARAQGAEQIAIDRVSADAAFYNAAGVTALAKIAGLDVPEGDDATELGPRDVFIRRDPVPPGGPRPCTTLEDGTGVYLSRGPDVAPLARSGNLVCPSRSPRPYAGPDVGAPLSRRARSRRAALGRILEAAHRRGIRRAGFEESMTTDADFGGAAALRELARAHGLAPPPGGHNQALGADGVLVFRRQRVINFPRPCLGDPGGGIFLVRGHELQQLEYSQHLYCPTRTPPDYKAPLAD